MDKKKLRREITSFKDTELKEKYKNLSFDIVLVQPEHAGNIGSIARVMKNFNFNNLVIFNPLEKINNIKSYESQGFAMHGKDILLNAEIISLDHQQDHIHKFKTFMEQYNLIIATTAKGKHYRNIRRMPIFPENLKLPLSKKPFKIAILFGKESRGLTNEEIEIADILLRIPTDNTYSSLNISHACGIILYEIFNKLNQVSLGRGQNPVLIADKEDKKIFYAILKKLIDKVKIRTHKKENVIFAFKNIFERALITKKELSLIMGVFSKVDSIIKGLDLYK
ncbi:MAG: RNA methyltransferase [Candidatus Hermodarchaeota archaeon]